MQPNPTLYGHQNNAQKIRFIIITSIVAIVVLGIAVWAIVAMVSGKNKSNSTAKVETVSVTEQTEKKEEKKTSSTTSSNGSATTPVQTTPVETKKDDIPSTGPEEILPFALVLGSLTTYFGSLKLTKFNA